MVHITNIPFVRSPRSNKRKLSRLRVAGLLATSILAATTVAKPAPRKSRS